MDLTATAREAGGALSLPSAGGGSCHSLAPFAHLNYPPLQPGDIDRAQNPCRSPDDGGAADFEPVAPDLRTIGWSVFSTYQLVRAPTPRSIKPSSRGRPA